MIEVSGKILPKLAVVAMSVLCLGYAATAAPNDEAKRFDIGTQALATALSEFARQSDRQILFSTEAVDAKQTDGVKGELEPEAALRTLLRGTGLTFRITTDQTILVETSKQASSAAAAMASANLRLGQAENTQPADIQRSESPSPELPSEKSGTFGIQEIVVTAQRREERLQDVPVTVSAISGEDIRERAALEIKDLLAAVPGLSFSNVERGQSKYAIRGIANSVTSPTTGVYLDDVSLITQANFASGAFDALLFDLDRVEVLKGPQGTLYGGSAMGGAIKYVSAVPDPTKLQIDAAAGVSTTAHGDLSYTAEGVINIPLVQDVLALRAGLSYVHEGGYIDNVANLDIERAAFSSTPFPVYTPQIIPSLSDANRKDYNFSDSYVGKLSLLWQPSASLSVRPTLIYQDSTSENPPYYLPDEELLSTYRFTTQETPDRAGIYSLTVDKQWAAAQLTSLTAYFDREVTWNRDYSFFIGQTIGAFYPNDSFIVFPQHTTVFSQEFRLASSPGEERRLKWLIGAYYSEQDGDLGDGIGIYTHGAGLPGDLFFGNTSNSYLDQHAAFGEVTYAVTPALDLTIGARWFEIEQGSRATLTGFAAGGGSIQTAPLYSKESGLNPKIGLSYELGANHLLYASAAKGFRPGGPVGALNALSCEQDLTRLGLSGTPTQFDSDAVWSYEIGSKNEFNSGRTLLNASVFYTEWSDIQQNLRLISCGANLTVNAGKAEVKGAELEARLNVLPGVQLGAALTYTDAVIVEASPTGTGAQEGDQIQDTPEKTASAFAIYSQPVTASWEMDLRAEYRYQDRQRKQFDTTQTVRFSDGTVGAVPYAALWQGSFDVANVSINFSNGPRSIQFFAKNVFDAGPQIDTFSEVGITRTTTLRPRTIGMNYRQRF